MKSVPWRDICVVMFIALLFTIAQVWEQSKCPLIVVWIKKMWHMNLMEYYWTLKKEEIPAICNSMDEVWGYYAKWNKPNIDNDCGSDHELLIGKFRLKLKKVGKTTRSFRHAAAAAAAKLIQSCPTLCDPIDSSPPGSPVPGILHARTLEWVAISFSNAWKWKGKVKSLNRVWLLATPWTVAYQAPLFMGFSRQEYWRNIC